MSALFAETLKRLRTGRGLSQQEFADRMYVAQSTVARWENGNRLPDATMMSQISQCLGVDVGTLMSIAAEGGEIPNVIMVEDRDIVLAGSLAVVKEVMPHARIAGFAWPSEAVSYARQNRVSLAFLDIELGDTDGFELCRALLDINPRTNVVYLTAYSDYALDAWATGASGFMLKPITPESVRAQLENLRYPFSPGGAIG